MSDKNLTSLVEFYNVITKISVKLVKNQFDNIEFAIHDVLGIIGKYAKVERSYIFTIDYYNQYWCNDYEWCSNQTDSQIENLAKVPLKLFSYWLDTFKKNVFVLISDVSQMEASEEKSFLEDQDIISLLGFPMFHGDKLFGFIGFDAVREKRSWDEQHKTLLKFACNILGSTLSNKRYKEELVLKNTELEDALANVKLLSGLIPICANCKKIRDDKGYWNQLESYISKHSTARFSHGICPDCQHKLYPELFPDKPE